VGSGFEVNRTQSAKLTDGTTHTWTERWLVTRSDALAQRRQKAWEKRLQRAQSKLSGLKAKKGESAAAVLARAERIVKQHKLSDILSVQVHETIREEKHYIGPGRPGPNRPFELHEVSQIQVTFERDDAAWDVVLALAGWRIYVTNAALGALSLDQAITYYRDEWLVERGYHRFKQGSLPVLPLWVRLPERIRGLMLLLLFALQALTLMDFVARRELVRRQETLAGLVPGNPKMKTVRPTAERMLARFQNLHLMVKHTQTSITGEIVESLTPLQRRILELLGIPETVYEIQFSRAAHNP
jgi:transposase